mgnify:CR=1 FL=1
MNAETKTQYVARVEEISYPYTLNKKLFVPHTNGEKVFASPVFRQGNYRELGAGILENNMILPGRETSSLLHPAYCTNANDEAFQEVRNSIRYGWLSIFLQELSTDYGFYSIVDKKALGTSIDAGALEKRLARQMKHWKKIKGTGIRTNEDRSIQFVEEGAYARGEVTAEELATDNGMIANYNKEGAEKLSEVAAQLPDKRAVIHRLKIEKGQAPQLRVSTLDECDNRLRVIGSDFDELRGGGHAFGVLRS